MTWTPVPPSDAHRQALRGHDVVGTLQTSITFISEVAKVGVSSSRPLTVLEEFTMRAVLDLSDLQGAGAISDLLGLGQPAFVEPIVNRLGQTGLIRLSENGYLAPEPRLRDLYERRTWEEITATTVSGFLCPLTGERHAEVEGLSNQEGPAGEVPPPDADAFADWCTSDGAPLAAVRRDRIREVTFLERYGGLGLLCDVVVYTDDTEGVWYWEPYLPGERRIAVEYREVCRSLGAEEAALALVQDLEAALPPDPPTKSTVRERVETLKSKGGISVKRYGTTDARQAIVNRITSAKEEVIATFPWIKSGALTDDLLKAIKKALSRGAFVYVTYGITSCESDEESHPEAIAVLRALKAPNTGGAICIAWVGHSHAKEILVDQTHYLGGSFNRFSFRGDPSRSGVVRRESMIYTNDAAVIHDARASIVPGLLAALVRDASQAPRLEGSIEWLHRWRPILRLDWTRDTLRTALAYAPESGVIRQEILTLLLRQVVEVRLEPDIAVNLLATIPDSFLADSAPLSTVQAPSPDLAEAVDRAEVALGRPLSQLRASLELPSHP